MSGKIPGTNTQREQTEYIHLHTVCNFSRGGCMTTCEECDLYRSSWWMAVRSREMLGVEGCGLFRGDVFWSNDYKEKSGQRFPLESKQDEE